MDEGTGCIALVDGQDDWLDWMEGKIRWKSG